MRCVEKDVYSQEVDTERWMMRFRICYMFYYQGYMRIELVSMGYVRYVRRRMRGSGLRLSVRWGRVYTVRDVSGSQPDSEAQLRSRSVLAMASARAKVEMAVAERRLYWDTHAAEMGYKTGRGACVAYHVRCLMREATRPDEVERMRRVAEERRARRRERQVPVADERAIYECVMMSVRQRVYWDGRRLSGRRRDAAGCGDDAFCAVSPPLQRRV